MNEQPTPSLTPFASTYTPNLPELLQKLQCSIAITTYQAGKVLFISAKDSENLSLLPRTFHKAMGMALKNDRLAIATKSEVVILQNSPNFSEILSKEAECL